MTNNYKQLVDKLDSFIKKYQFVLLLKRVIVLFMLLIVYISIISIYEYLVYLPSSIRQIVYFLSLLLILVAFVYLFFIPFLKLVGVIKGLSYRKASSIISSYYSEIKDQLTNILELAETESSNSLVWASIDNKISKIKNFDFKKTIQLKGLRALSISFLVLVFGVIIINVTIPDIYTSSLNRIINYQQTFIKPAPFTFQLLNDDLNFKKGDSVEIKVLCEGREEPEAVYINIAGTNYIMSDEEEYYTYQIDQIHNNLSIYFTDLEYKSENYQINILPNPTLINYSVEVNPPAYTSYSEEEIENTGDLNVPYGTELIWNFNAIDTDSLKIVFKESEKYAEKKENNFVINHQAIQNEKYSVSLINEFFNSSNILQYQIEVIPDLYPEIQIVQMMDSLNYTRFYFKGSISDDYGFHDLKFHLNLNQNDSTINLDIIKNMRDQDFYFSFDFNQIKGLAQSTSYYFTVEDNDYFHDYKETSSDVFEYIFPSERDIIDSDNQLFSELQDLMDDSYQLSEDLQNQIEDLKYRSISENISDWEKQQLINEILNKENQLENVLNQIENKNSEMNNKMNSFTEEKAEIIEKQQQIEELLNEVMNDELKALFDELNKLAQEFDQSRFNDLMENAEMSMDDLSRQLERNLEMLRQMKIEQKIENVIQLLESTLEEEKVNLSDVTENRNFESVSDKEKDNQELMENLRQEMNSAIQMNDSLENSMDLFSVDEEFKKINDKYDEVLDNLEKNRKRRSEESISDNIEMIENQIYSLNQMLENNRKQQHVENIQNLKQILDNLIYISVNQENILLTTSSISTNDPSYNSIIEQQNHLSYVTTVTKDSLYALANRTPSISKKVTDELLKLDYSLNQSISELTEGNFSTVLVYQQNSITSVNEMALFLNEALENLENQDGEGQSGEGDNPNGQGKMGMSKLKEAQQSLKDQMQQMIEQLKNGNGENMSQQIGKSLIQQEMIQQMINELMMDSGVGSSAKEQLKQMELLNEQNRIDLMNKNITSEMISRQNLILNKLLEAEKSERERDVDDERESKTASDEFYSNPAEFFEYKLDDEEMIENIQYNNYRLRNFYDKKYRNYLNQLNK